MKKIILYSTLFLLLFWFKSSFGQCPTDVVILNTQNQVNSFLTSYPNCTESNYSISIKPISPDLTTDITNLNGLSKLKHIDGELSILNCHHLNSLSGLSSLDSLETLKLVGCHALKSFEGLSQLKKLNTLHIGVYNGPYSNSMSGNDSLTTFQGLDSIKEIDQLYIHDTPISNFLGLERIHELKRLKIVGTSLQNFIGLDSLEFINSLTIGTYNDYSFNFTAFSTIGNTNLVDFTGLNQLKRIGGLAIFGEGPSSFQGLSSLEEIQTIQITDNLQIQNFTGLSKVKKISNIYLGTILKYNAYGTIGEVLFPCGIKDFSGLDLIDSISKISLSHSSLESFNGLESITEIDKILINSAPNLTDLEGLNAITRINEYLLIKDAPVKNVKDLSNLEYAKSIALQSTNTESLDGLQNLKEVENLNISNGKITTFVHLASLGAITGNLTISNLDSLTSLNMLGNVTHIGGDLQISDNDNLGHLGLQIKTIGQNLRIGGVNQSKLWFPHIHVFDYYYTETPNNKITSLAGLENLDSIGGSLIISSNPNLTSLTGLSNNLFIGNDVNLGLLVSDHQYPHKKAIGNPKLTNISALGILDTIYGSLQVIGNPQLEHFSGLENLNHIANRLTIIGNHALINLNGLNGLKSVDSLIIGYYYGNNDWDIGNDALSDLNGIDNLTIDTYLSINNNKSLSTCNVFPICQYLDDPSKPTLIANNATGCNSTNEINISCAFHSLAGEVFYDYNQNKIHDDNEGTISNQRIWLTPQNQEILTDQNGQFHKFCFSGINYFLEWMEDPDWILTTDSISYTISSFTPGLPNNLNKDFGLYPSFSTHQGLIDLSSNSTRCNTDVDFFLRHENLGTFLESGSVRLQYDPSCSFVSAYPNVGLTVDTFAKTLEWAYDSLYPFQYQDMSIILAMPDQNSTNNSLQFLVELFRDSMNTEILLDSYTYTPTVLCSFDPNDKQVMPAGVRDEHYTLHDQKLTYTVRFQNTGNAEAIDIRILDTIDTDLDINTLRIVNSSFPVQTSVKDQAIEFLFKNIWLPDSTHNEPESHGFITYQIKPKAGLADYTEIENTAHIIFDFNDAIVTNTTKNTMVTVIPVGLKEIEKTEITIWPNPADDIIYISAKNQQPIDKVIIYSTLGELVLTQKGNKVDVGHLPKGIYLVKVEMGDLIGVEKLVVD